MRPFNTLLAVVVLVSLPTAALAQLVTGTADVTLHAKTIVQVESGRLQVPESRTRRTDRTVTIPFYRLRSTAAVPAAPIFLLAGGLARRGSISSRQKRPIARRGSIRRLPTSCCSISAAADTPFRR